jgi:hypothetical protein
MEVPRADNNKEAAALWAMQSDPACKMATSTGLPVLDYPGSTVQKFLVVPTAVPLTVAKDGTVTYVGPPSAHVCGFEQTITGGGGGGGGPINT